MAVMECSAGSLSGISSEHCAHLHLLPHRQFSWVRTADPSQANTSSLARAKDGGRRPLWREPCEGDKKKTMQTIPSRRWHPADPSAAPPRQDRRRATNPATHHGSACIRRCRHGNRKSKELERMRSLHMCAVCQARSRALLSSWQQNTLLRPVRRRSRVIFSSGNADHRVIGSMQITDNVPLAAENHGHAAGHLSSHPGQSRQLRPRKYIIPPGSLNQRLPKRLQHLLDDRRFRLLVFTVITDVGLRTNKQLVRNVGRRLALAGKRDGSAAGAATLALRLGYLRGQKRGRAWEALHQRCVPHGRLPTEMEVFKAVKADGLHVDLSAGLGRDSSPTARADVSTWSTPRWTKYYNLVLSTWLRRHHARSSLAHPPTGIGTSLKPPPTSDLRQLHQLLACVRRLQQTRGFKPNGVTGAIILKCWIRCLSEPPRATDHHSTWASVHDLTELFERTAELLSDTPLPGRDSTASTGCPANLNDKGYKLHIRPIGKMFVSAFRDKGRHDLVEKVLDWMRVRRSAARP